MTYREDSNNPPRPHRAGNYWAMWWGISFGLAFLAAATISFSMIDKPPVTDGPGHVVSSLVP
jgi:hypothetical protein